MNTRFDGDFLKSERGSNDGELVGVTGGAVSNSELPFFEEIWIAEESRETDVAKRFVSLYPNKVRYCAEKPFDLEPTGLTKKEFDASKRKLWIHPFKGQFFKRCPGAKPNLSCCNYFVLNLGLQCNMNCSYCYLQSYINSPMTEIYSNIDQAIDEMRQMSAEYPEYSYRVGTGEIVDSLSLDPLTLYSRKLIEFFRTIPHWQLEFKTKSDKVDQFLDVEHAGNVIVSWSVNPQYIVQKEEHLTASLTDRLLAAQKCRVKGFKLAFHIDPMIWFEEWQKAYAELVAEITGRFTPADIMWITVGALRFQPEQRHIMRERFGFTSLVSQAEMYLSRDGKMRYDSNLRNEMFQFVFSEFKKADSNYKVTLCMESRESWVKTLSGSPSRNPELQSLFKPIPKPNARI
ncbi:MAG: radical SAM protein [Bdellovibrionales bacterium CG10_big_fil_rev_8_21_14_0_10_45_34]|nr:MAG: radical SAM protein [Bdellovibrionales bacterium CG10_big_fil_rev_8_21_14_0_10_45_34]